MPSPGNATPIESFAKLLIQMAFDRIAFSNGLHVRICSLQDVKGIFYDSGITSGPPGKRKFNMIKGWVHFSVTGETLSYEHVATWLQHASYLQFAKGHNKRFPTWGLYLRGSIYYHLQRFVISGKEHKWEDSVLVMDPQTLDHVRKQLSSEEWWAFCDIGTIFDVEDGATRSLRIDGGSAAGKFSTKVDQWFPLECVTEMKLALLPHTFSEVYTAILHSHPQVQANFRHFPPPSWISLNAQFGRATHAMKYNMALLQGAMTETCEIVEEHADALCRPPPDWRALPWRRGGELCTGWPSKVRETVRDKVGNYKAERLSPVAALRKADVRFQVFGDRCGTPTFFWGSGGYRPRSSFCAFAQGGGAQCGRSDTMRKHARLTR